MCKNPYGTRSEFNKHFDELPDTERKVCRIAMDGNPIDVAPQEYDKQAEALVVLMLLKFESTLTLSLASGKEDAETQMTAKLVRTYRPQVPPTGRMRYLYTSLSHPSRSVLVLPFFASPLPLLCRSQHHLSRTTAFDALGTCPHR